MVASPSRSTVNVSERDRSTETASTASGMLLPAMNLRASRRAPQRTAAASNPASGPWLGSKRSSPQGRPRKLIAGFGEVFAQVPDDAGGSLQLRENVHEAEHLELDRFVGHAQAHQPIVPPRGTERHRTGKTDTGKDLFADSARERFDVMAHKKVSFRAACLLAFRAASFTLRPGAIL